MAKARYRILTWRMVVAAVLVGVVLAVTSVPVAALIQGMPLLSSVGSTTLRYGIDVDSGLYFRAKRDAFLGSVVWDIDTTDFFSSEELAFMLTEGVGEPVETIGLPSPLPTEIARRNAAWIHVRAGWPARAALAYTEACPKNVYVQKWTHGLSVGSTLIPLRPIWMGLLANAFSYTAIALVPLVLLRWRRTRRRQARGLCVACGYELGRDVDVCPECGLAEPTAFRIL